MSRGTYLLTHKGEEGKTGDLKRFPVFYMYKKTEFCAYILKSQDTYKQTS